MALLIQCVSGFWNEFLSLSNRKRNRNDVEVVWCQVSFHLLQTPGHGSIASGGLLLSSGRGGKEHRVPPPGPDPEVWAIPLHHSTLGWLKPGVPLVSYFILLYCILHIATNRVFLRSVRQSDNFLHLMLQVFLIWLIGFVNFYSCQNVALKSLFCLVWRVAQISAQIHIYKQENNKCAYCILKRKRNSPVIVIKITTIYETIILKHFKNSIIIQSAKQLVFYDGTDFIVAGYRVKHL